MATADRPHDSHRPKPPRRCTAFRRSRNSSRLKADPGKWFESASSRTVSTPTATTPASPFRRGSPARTRPDRRFACRPNARSNRPLRDEQPSAGKKSGGEAIDRFAVGPRQAGKAVPLASRRGAMRTTTRGSHGDRRGRRTNRVGRKFGPHYPLRRMAARERRVRTLPRKLTVAEGSAPARPRPTPRYANAGIPATAPACTRRS